MPTDISIAPAPATSTTMMPPIFPMANVLGAFLRSKLLTPATPAGGDDDDDSEDETPAQPAPTNPQQIIPMLTQAIGMQENNGSTNPSTYGRKNTNTLNTMGRY